MFFFIPNNLNLYFTRIIHIIISKIHPGKYPFGAGNPIAAIPFLSPAVYLPVVLFPGKEIKSVLQNECDDPAEPSAYSIVRVAPSFLSSVVLPIVRFDCVQTWPGQPTRFPGMRKGLFLLP